MDMSLSKLQEIVKDRAVGHNLATQQQQQCDYSVYNEKFC